MGLDNGIFLRSKRELKSPNFIDSSRYVETDDDGNQYFEYYVLYWRKWWGFRNDVMNELGFADGDYSFPLTVEQLEKIQEIYNYYNSVYDIINEIENVIAPPLKEVINHFFNIYFFFEILGITYNK